MITLLLMHHTVSGLSVLGEFHVWPLTQPAMKVRACWFIIATGEIPVLNNSNPVTSLPHAVLISLIRILSSYFSHVTFSHLLWRRIAESCCFCKSVFTYSMTHFIKHPIRYWVYPCHWHAPKYSSIRLFKGFSIHWFECVFIEHRTLIRGSIHLMPERMPELRSHPRLSDSCPEKNPLCKCKEGKGRLKMDVGTCLPEHQIPCGWFV